MSKTVLITTSRFGQEDMAPLRRLEAEGMRYVFNPYARRLTTQELIELLKGTEYLIAGVEPITEEVFERHPQLKLIVRCGSGMDNVDLAAARKHGVAVQSTPEAPVLSVAELTLGLILATLRSVCFSDRAIRRGAWPKPGGAILTGKTVGILGLGRIGRKLTSLLEPFSVDILAYDVLPDRKFADEKKISFVSSDDLFERADVVTIHLPLNEQTRHLVDRNRLERMKPSSVLINVARGGIVDEDALADCLGDNKIKAAAVDVFKEEPYQGRLTKMENVILTSHIGSYTAEARVQMESQAVDHVLEFIHAREKQDAKGL